MKIPVSIYWSRRDFRINDNPALTSAIKYAKENDIDFLPMFIIENYMCENNPKYQFGYPSRVFISKALPIFADNFDNFYLTKGKILNIFKKLSEKYDINVFVNEDIHEDFYAQLKKLKENNIKVKLYPDTLTVSKETVTGTGNKYSIFTPFKKAVWTSFVSTDPIKKVNLENIKYLSKKDIDINENKIIKHLGDKKLFLAGKTIYDIDNFIKDKMQFDKWYFSEKEVTHLFTKYLKNNLSLYKEKRDFLDLEATSHMSVALAWGLISARSLVHMIKNHTKTDFINFDSETRYQGEMHFISELIWREFYKYLYFHNPSLMNQEFQERFRGKIEWIKSSQAKKRFEAWIKGETGYPIVDAAMCELNKTGYMHNRARMIVASVLTKNLGVDWRWGQEYFRAMLIDLDEASNNGGWQWGASVGADPKPIRIFNPYLQAENYDKDQIYQRKYLSKEYIQNPPKPIIQHKDARNEALERYGLDYKKDGFPRDF